MPRLFFLIPVLCFQLNLNAQGYRIETCLTPLTGEEIYLGHHFFNEKYVIDTCMLDKNGCGVFSGKDQLHEGVYFIVLPGMRYFDFLVTENQHFKILNDTSDLTGSMGVINDIQNQLFVRFQKFVAEKKMIINNLNNRIVQFPDSAEIIQSEISALQNDITRLRDSITGIPEGGFIRALLKSLEPPEFVINLPDSSFTEEESTPLHFFDNYDFADERLLYTPVLYNLVRKFLYRYSGLPFEILKNSTGNLLALSMKNPKIYRLVLEMLMRDFDASGNFTNEDMFVHISRVYCLSGLAPWVNKSFTDRLKSYIKTLEPALLGSKAPPLVLPDTAGTFTDIYKISSDYLLLVFWSPDCKGCAVYLEELKLIRSRFTGNFLQIVATVVSENLPQWKEIIRDNNLNWINLYCDSSKPEDIEPFNLYTVPRLFLLDKNKIIIMKDMPASYISGFLERNTGTH